MTIMYATLEIDELRQRIADLEDVLRRSSDLIEGCEHWGAERILIANQMRAALRGDGLRMPTHADAKPEGEPWRT